MNNHLKFCIFIFTTFHCSINSYAQDTKSSSEFINNYILSANISFERSGAASYTPPEDFQFVNNFGISISRRISKRFWIEINPQLVKNKTTLGLEQNFGYYEYSFISDNVRIPFNLQMYLNSFYFKAGPYIDFLLDIRSGSNSDINFDEYKVNTFGYGIGAATGMVNRIYKNLFIFVEMRFNQNIKTSLYPKNNKSYEGRFVNYGFNVGLQIDIHPMKNILPQ